MESKQQSLEEGIATLAEAHEKLTVLLEDLESELRPTLDQWEGDAHNTYVEVQRSWDASSAKQQEIVQDMSHLLGNN